MKKFFISFLIVASFFSTVVYAGTLVKKVYFSPYPILIDNEDYSSETPILQYQDRTYVSLREFSEMVGVKVDFVDNKIIINTKKYSKENLLDKEKDDEIVIEKIDEESVEETDTTIIHDEKTTAPNDKEKNDSIENIRIVYVSKSGKKYHNLNNCNGAEYTGITISEAIGKGYTPCLRCANIK